MKGYVYVFHQLGTTYYKIGYTTKESVKDRFISFKMYAPNGGEIISVIESENPSRLEKEMHLKFSDKRLNGEFFSLNENDLYILKSFQDKRTRDIIDFVLTEIISVGGIGLLFRLRIPSLRISRLLLVFRSLL